MKHIKYLLIPLTIASFNVAASNLPAKQVSIPFSNEKILSTNHSGLIFNYDMNGQPGKKIVCKLSKIYKSWIEFSDKGVVRESGTFGSHQTVTFSNKENSHDQDESHSIYHADAVGKMTINEVDRDTKSKANASCHYVDAK